MSDIDQQPEPDTVTREAKLFEAGDYPDRGVNVTEDDLDRLVENFEPVPIHVEHQRESRIKLGTVARIWRKGHELLGTLNLQPAASALIDDLGIRGLSIAVGRGLDRIHEVSWTGSPRVADARVFRADLILFSVGDSPRPDEVKETMPTIEPESTAPDLSALEASIETLQRELAAEREKTAALRSEFRRRQAETIADRLSAEGKLSPANREFAVALLASEDVVLFADGSKPLSEAAIAFFDSLAPLVAPGFAVRGAVQPDNDLISEFKKLGYSDADAATAATFHRKEA